MLDPYLDFRMVQGKVEDALKKRLEGMYPCLEGKWRMFLKEFGIVAAMSEEDGYRSGFMRVADPMRGYVFNADGDCFGTWGGILYVPDEVAEKILVLGDLP